MRGRSLIALASLLLVLGACGDDDGADVRNVGGSGSPSGSGTGTGSGTGSATGHVSGTEGGHHGAGAACEPVGENLHADAEVHVTLDEYSIDTDVPGAGAGRIEFEIDNKGHEAHELVIVRARSAASLPVDDMGGLDEDKLKPGALIGEVEPFEAGEDCHGTFELEAGNYVLLCNVVEAEHGAHFEQGMFTEFKVT